MLSTRPGKISNLVNKKIALILQQIGMILAIILQKQSVSTKAILLRVKEGTNCTFSPNQEETFAPVLWEP